MNSAQYVLRQSEDGRVWSHGVKKNGQVSQAGCVVSREEADEMVRTGEAAWESAAPSKPAGAPSRRGSYERTIHKIVDAGNTVDVRHWGAAMNRDE